MKISKGVQIERDKNEDWVFKVKRNIYGQKQAGRVWNQHLVTRLKGIGFKQSRIDPCVFY